MTVVYEDNHIIVVNKTASEIVQADKTGDTPLSETVKQYLKEKYQKPGNVFLGVTHRLDRPVSGLVIFAKTSKALTRLNEMFRTSEVKKTYWAVVKNAPQEPEGELVHFLVRNEKQNKSYAYDKEVPNSKKAILHYRLIGHSENYYLLEVDLKTGRHHQIRCQLAKMGCPIKGDLKYGSPRSNPDGTDGNLQKDLRLKRSWPAVTTFLGRRSIYLIHGIIKMQTTKLRDFIGDRLGTGNNCL